MRVLDADQARRLDALAIERMGLPSMVLMENAALGVVEAIGARFPECRRPLIVCGPGSNGGDGFAIARQLLARGYRPRVVGAGEAGARGDAGAQRRAWEALGGQVLDLGPDPGTAAFGTILDEAAREADLVVDALFGTGLRRAVSGGWADLVSTLGSIGLPRLAVDLPSGLDASRAQPIGPVCGADLTVTFGCLKLAHVLPPAADFCGEVVVADLGCPAWLADDVPGPRLSWMGEDDMAPLLRPRPIDLHKGGAGRVLVVGGSPRLRGAPLLAARGALRSGAGLVTVAGPDAVMAALTVHLPEAMSRSVEWNDGSGIAEMSVVESEDLWERQDALVVGPGLGRLAGTRRAVETWAGACRLPWVLDADGVHPWAGRAAELRRRGGPTVLTPHAGELAALLGVTPGAIEADRLGEVRRAAELTGAVVVLKGRRTLVAAPDGEASVNTTGGPVLAAGGTGDVLAGMTGTFLAQGYEPFAAAQLACHLHGLAADRWTERHGDRGALAREIADEVPQALHALLAAAREGES